MSLNDQSFSVAKARPSLSLPGNWQTCASELQAAFGGLIEALETPQETPEPELEGGGDREESGQRSQNGSKGHIEAKYIPRGNKRHGPYLYLRYWQGGKLRSKYLGKAQQK